MTAGQIEYRHYLKSWRWQIISGLRKRWDKRCRICGKRTTLQVHHSSYIHRGKDGAIGMFYEWMDCITVCSHHHKTAHEGLSIREFAD